MLAGRVAAGAASEVAAPPARPAVHWHFLTGEYPAAAWRRQHYTRLVAQGLSRGRRRDHLGATVRPAGEGVSRRDGPAAARSIRTSLAACLAANSIGHQIRSDGWFNTCRTPSAGRPRTCRFCLWLRSRRRDSLWVMFHEVAYPPVLATASPSRGSPSSREEWLRWSLAAQRVFVRFRRGERCLNRSRFLARQSCGFRS